MANDVHIFGMTGDATRTETAQNRRVLVYNRNDVFHAPSSSPYLLGF
jgi:hypothetical protein